MAASIPPPEVNLSEQYEKEKNDPAMIKYLQSLGIDPSYVAPKDDPRRCVINEFSIVFKEGHDPITLKLNSEEDIKSAAKTPLVIKEGTEFKIRIMFRVQHNVVLGLKIVNHVKRMGKTVADDEEMLGTYPPKNDFQQLEIPRNDWNEAPSGMLLRGEYKSSMQFIDDDKKCHLQFDYILKIAKDWNE
eukprot:TRINITY_DN780_c0_g1_i1.p1 TRINITY_DN780_c0_g1~~TRINITY_DN780_c0_g1_i1.p1  ORF type:complete len:208 (-),score=88.55 TRINITY_DN780_c0_g1_i1:111-674(-)